MRAVDADILIIPGLNNSGPEHWQSRWQEKLSTARRVFQDDWQRPSRLAWESSIKLTILDSSRPVVLIAHSLGVIAALHAAQSVSDKIAGAFLVAPPSETVMREIPTINCDFLPAPRQPLVFPTILVGSRDDPYADHQYTRDLALDLGAKFVDAGAAGHLNIESGHGPWPEGLVTFAHFIAKL